MKVTLILMCVILFTGVFNMEVFCGDNSESDGIEILNLTVDDAFEIAVKYNREVINLEEDFPFLQKDYEEANKDLGLDPDIYADEYNSMKVQIAKLKNTLDNYDENVEQTKDILKYNITKLFIDIINAENELELEKKNISLLKKELDFSKIKYQKGILSENEFNIANVEYLKRYSELENKKIDFNNLFIDLNKVLGIDLLKQYSVSVDLMYDEIDNVDIDEKSYNDFENSFSLKEQKQNLEISKYEYSTYDENTSYSEKVSKENDILSKERNIKESEQNFKESLSKLYKDILSKETINKKYEEELVYKENEMEILKMKYSMGQAIQLDIVKKEMEIEELKNNIEKNQYEHLLLVMRFENPDLIEVD